MRVRLIGHRDSCWGAAGILGLAMIGNRFFAGKAAVLGIAIIGHHFLQVRAPGVAMIGYRVRVGLKL
ncbi:MAG: hypothetical protein C5B52_01045 [Bacteroidetes bacterium]|nr:MAG: hypothetical protein C5B52_01045 [Bacteroidota bacterium]